MEFKYNLTKKDYQNAFYKARKQNKILLVVVWSIFFFIIAKTMRLNHMFTLLIAYLFYIIVMFGLSYFIDKLAVFFLVKINEKKLKIQYGTYICKITEEKIVDGIGKSNIEVYFKDINKIIYKPNTICIISKHNNVILNFEKVLFEKPEQFEELQKILKEKVIITK